MAKFTVSVIKWNVASSVLIKLKKQTSENTFKRLPKQSGF